MTRPPDGSDRSGPTDADGVGCFQELELQTIKDAVTDAERGTSGEIVTYITESCDTYPEALWRGALIGALLCSVAAALLHGRLGGWGFNPWMGAVVPAVAGGLVGYAVLRWSGSAQRLLADRSRVERAVQWRAEGAFLEEGVFKTTARTGVLLFLALAERRAVVLADEGIHAVVPPDRWADLVEILSDGMRTGQHCIGVVRAIDACGQIFREYVPDDSVRQDSLDRNELEDRPRVRSEEQGRLDEGAGEG